MAIPHDDDIQFEVLKLLSKVPAGTMYCMDVYRELAKRYPQLTEDEVEFRYKNSVSHWANRVQFARWHLIEKGFIYRPYVMNDRGFWTITEAGRRWVFESEVIAENLLIELGNFNKD